MKNLFLFFFLLCNYTIITGQSTGNFRMNLVSCRSADGIEFFNLQKFEDAAEMPSIIKDTNGVIITAFQWIAPTTKPGSAEPIAVKFSYDEGNTWTQPVPVMIPNLPPYFQKPNNPVLALTDNGKIRLYFSSCQKPFTDTLTGIYSAISNDGINYSWEPGCRFHPANHSAIEPAVIKLNTSWHLLTAKGEPQDGSFHAVSGDGINFIQVHDITSNYHHHWKGNFMNEHSTIRFYGTGAVNDAQIWFTSSPNGGVWAPYINTNQQGQDPAVVKIASNDYLMIYSTNTTSETLEEISPAKEIKIVPSPVLEKMKIYYPSQNPLNINPGELNLEVYEAPAGKPVVYKLSGINEAIDLHNLKPGFYFIRLCNGKNCSAMSKLIKI